MMLRPFFKKGIINSMFMRNMTTLNSQQIIDKYYKKEFTNVLQFTEQKKPYPLFRVMDLEGKIINPQYENIDKETCLNILEKMLENREMDEIYQNAQRQNRITFYMTSKLEEAVTFGTGIGIKRDDSLFVQYREFPILFLRGWTPKNYLDHLHGNHLSKEKGRALALCVADKELELYPNSAPLGNRAPHASGAGFLYRVQGLDKIALNFLGDGSSSEGDVYAAMNFGAVLNSQTLFVIRNNVYAISTFISDQYRGDGVGPRGIGLGIPFIKVDGMDLFAVYNAVKEARKMILERKSPVIVECHTYRCNDHSTSDSAAGYRTKERLAELEPYLKSLGDPLDRLGKYCQSKGWIQNFQEHQKEASKKYRAVFIKLVAELEKTNFCHYEEMLNDVYAEAPPHLVEQMNYLRKHVANYISEYPVQYFTGGK